MSLGSERQIGCFRFRDNFNSEEYLSFQMFFFSVYRLIVLFLVTCGEVINSKNCMDINRCLLLLFSARKNVS